MANEPEIKHARSFAITKALSLITEQGTEVPCCLDPRTTWSALSFVPLNGGHYSTKGYYYCDDDGK